MTIQELSEEMKRRGLDVVPIAQLGIVRTGIARYTAITTCPHRSVGSFCYRSLKGVIRSQTMVEFVSYSGGWPNLCSGNLVVKIDGEEVNLGRCLRSGGSCYFSSDWEEHVTKGAWKIDELPEAYEKYRSEIEKVVNDNVPHGCCGGCV